MEHDFSTLLTLYKDHTQIVNTLWNIFQVVAIAALGFVYREQPIRENAGILVLLSVAFLVFAMGNQGAILRSQKVLYAVDASFHDASLLPSVKEPLRSALQAHSTYSVAETRRGHWALTGCLVDALWLPFLLGRKG